MEQNLSGAPGQTGSGSRGNEVKDQARQQGQQLARQARQQAGELANRGGEQIKSQLANQKHDASQRMLPIQSALRETAQQLRKQGQASVGQYADRAGDQVERFSSYLRETDVDEMTDEVRSFARRSPALFLGGAAALGFLATRFLKSSSQDTSAGDDSDATAVSRGAVTYGTGEPVTALPPGTVDRESPTAGRIPATGQPLDDIPGRGV